MKSLESLGWTHRLESLRSSLPDGQIGRVTRIDRGQISVSDESGSLRIGTGAQLHPSGEPGPAAVGDWLVFDEDRPLAILPRSGVLSRRRPGEADHRQVVAANVDLVLLVEPLDRGPNPRRLERGCALAWEAAAKPVVLLTKLDLCENPEAAIAKATEGAPWVDLISLSVQSGEGFDAIAEHLKAGITAVLIGPSGAGKSTLVNHLLGDQHLATGAVRAGDAKGRHTTTHRELVCLPSGGCLIDTPGIRELGLWLSADAIEAAFDDIAALSERCRFADCSHDCEPGCAVIDAIESGLISAARLDSYHRLQREVAVLESRRDARARQESKAKDRMLAKLVRAEIKRKGSG